jgi:transglutaminase-like putative cysteine protease
MALVTLLLAPAAADSAAWVPYLGPALAIVVLLGYWAGFGLTRPQVKAEARAGGAADPQGIPGWLAVILLALLGLLTVSLVVGWREAPAAPAAVPWILRLPAHAGLAVVDMAERLGQWIRDVRTGGAVQDDAIFRWILGIVAWAAAAWAGWWLYARRRPLVALLPAGLLLATNAYYYWNGRFWLPFYLGLLAVVAVLVNRHALERRWQRLGMDYSVDVRQDLLLTAMAISLLVAFGTLVMPRVVIRPTADWFEELAAAPRDKLSDAGKQLFPGLRRAPRPLLAEGGAVGGMPRSYLLGSGPELSQRVVMRIGTDELAGLAEGEAPSSEMSHYWRAVTYDVYDGRGWRNSAVEQEELNAGESWLEHVQQWRRPVRQQVEMVESGNRALFAAGEPLAVNRPYRFLLRTPSAEPADDLVALTGTGKRYQIVSLVPAASAEVLRAAGSAYPESVARRYLQLPLLPSRVTERARTVTAGAATPYDQAVALERYLRRYPYDLGVAPAPPQQDTVDYFLFDAKTGYCDYYASAMVVLARSVGIPARLATGYATGAYDSEARTFVVHGDDAHSWPELYFPGIGWFPFEPTGSRAALPLAAGAGERPQFGAGSQAQVQADLATFRDAQAARQRKWWAGGLVLSLLVVLGGAVAWLRRPQPALVESYVRLGRWGRRLGRPAGPGETPGEFGRGLSGHVRAVDAARGAATAGEVLEYVDRFEAAQYSPAREEAAREARRRWPQLERTLRRVWLRRLTARGRRAPEE